jgi:hypothetical protein
VIDENVEFRTQGLGHERDRGFWTSSGHGATGLSRKITQAGSDKPRGFCLRIDDLGYPRATLTIWVKAYCGYLIVIWGGLNLMGYVVWDMAKSFSHCIEWALGHVGD